MPSSSNFPTSNSTTAHWYKKYQSQIETYAANASGVVYSTGELGITSIGIWKGLSGNFDLMRENELVVGLISIASSSILARYGHKDTGFAAGHCVNLIGLTLASAEALSNGQLGAIAGYVPYVVATCLGFSPLVSRDRFRHAGESLLKPIAQGHKTGLETIKRVGKALVGTAIHHSRQTMSVIFTASDLPLFADAVYHKQWGKTLLYGSWLLGDALTYLSRPEQDRTQAPSALNS